MGSQFPSLSDKHVEFIGKQKVFFMASCSGEEVNLSPKGLDSIRVLDKNRLLYLDYPGSGNRTARDIGAGGDVTVVFTAFEGPALILRLFCKGELVEKSDNRFADLFANFSVQDSGPVRRLIVLSITTAEQSCGFGTPYMEFIGNREELTNWAEKKSQKGTLESYIEAHATPPELF